MSKTQNPVLIPCGGHFFYVMLAFCDQHVLDTGGITLQHKSRTHIRRRVWVDYSSTQNTTAKVLLIN